MYQQRNGESNLVATIHNPNCEVRSPPPLGARSGAWTCWREPGHDIPNSSDDLRHLAGIGGGRYVAEWDNDRSTD